MLIRTNWLRPALLALVVAVAAPGIADAAITAGPKSKITFTAVGSPGFLDIEGESETVTVTDDGTKLTFAVPMSSVSSGIDLRDQHMNEKYVEVAKFPNATLTLTKADVTWPTEVGQAATGTVKGTFNAHGVDQPTDITYTVKKSKTGYRVNAKFAFDCANHGIAIPSYMGVTVDPKMNAAVQIDLIDA